jgi:transcriptional regulator NrdR family protein
MEFNSDDSSTLGIPVCEHNNRFIRETRTRTDGLIRRRWECSDCGERWTVLGPDRKKRQRRRKRSKPMPKKLDLQHIRRALADRQTSDVVLAAELGVSRQAIQQIRSGKTWTKVFPNLKRRPQWRDCRECRHWDGDDCCLGFPDPLDEGTGFAADCDLYEV